MKHSANKIQIAGYDDLFGSSAPILLENVVEQVIEIPLEELHTFHNHPFQVLDDEKMEETVINVNAIDNLIGKVELIDIREPYEYKSGSIKTAKNIPMGNLLEDPNKYLIKDKTYYVMCQSGARSGRTTKKLAKQGFTVINVAGGMGSYSGKKRK